LLFHYQNKQLFNPPETDEAGEELKNCCNSEKNKIGYPLKSE
jgi:hypothetical protein